MARGRVAPKAKALAVATFRAGQAEAGDVFDLVVDAYVGGMDFTDALHAAQDEIAQRVIARHSEKIRNALQRAGLDVGGDDVLTLASIQGAVEAKSGLQIDDWSVEGVTTAIDAILSKKMTELTGVEITSVKDAASLQEALKAGIKIAVENGKAEKLVTWGLTRAARAAVTWKRNGVNDVVEKRKIQLAAAQKRYRSKNRQVWD